MDKKVLYALTTKIFSALKKLGIKPKLGGIDKIYENVGDAFEYIVKSNYHNSKNDKDTSSFDILFNKITIPDYSHKIRVELLDGNNTVVYSREDSVGHYKNVHYTNFPNEKNVYAIRINLQDKPNLILNENNYDQLFKLFIYDVTEKKPLYGKGRDDLSFKFRSKPYSE